jgi:PAS domain S-box-containing protein
LLLRKVEEAWQESNGEFSAMFDLGGIGMIQADAPAFRFTRANPKFCEIVGYSADELQTKTYIELTHPRDRKRDLKAIARVIRGKTDSWFIEKHCLRKDGRDIRVGVHGIALRNQAGQAVRIMAMVEDITTRKQPEQRQRDALARVKMQFKKRIAKLSKTLRLLRSQITGRKKVLLKKNLKAAGRKPSKKSSLRRGHRGPF